MEREPAAAGQFYPADKKELKKQIDGFFKGIGKTHDKRVFGIIAPHAGYYYSGKCAAYAYNAISELKIDTFIVLGTKHSAIGKNIAVSMQDFKMPLGIAKNDREFSEKLAKLGYEDETAHEHEHSIEVQIPFLQCCFKSFMIVPIVIHAELDECKKLAKTIVSIAMQLKRKICIIASSDFTHYGSSYDFLPFSGSDEETLGNQVSGAPKTRKFSSVRKRLYALDKKAIDAICKMNSEKFAEIAGKTTICGTWAIATAIEACKMLGAKKGKLLKYYTSADISGSYDTSVSYASIKFA